MIDSLTHINGFTNVRLSGWKLRISNRFPADIPGEFLGQHTIDNVRGPFNEITASKFAKTFNCSIGFSGRSETVYIKHYLHRSWLDFIKHLFRKGRAQRAFDASLMLQDNSFNVPDIIALGRFGFGLAAIKSFLITRELKNAKAIHICLKENWECPNGSTPPDKIEFIIALGKTIGRMHRSGIFHGDLRLGNVFAEKENGKWKFFFLDNERTGKFKNLPQKLIIKNLVQLNMHRRDIIDLDRDTFFKAYLSEHTLDGNKKQQIISKVFELTDKRLKAKSN
jgi:tRNA A-37 threonylcarbamoyl transferase component Bud32